MNSIFLSKQNNIEISRDTLSHLGVELRYEDFITQAEISQIHEVSSRHRCLEVKDTQCYRHDAANGVLKLYKSSELLGYIFAHRGKVDDIVYYERGSLWVSKNLAGNALGTYLMREMTQKLQGKNILSVTSNTTVQKINEILMDYEIINPNKRLQKMIERRGKMKDNYRYFVNEKLMKLL